MEDPVVTEPKLLDVEWNIGGNSNNNYKFRLKSSCFFYLKKSMKKFIFTINKNIFQNMVCQKHLVLIENIFGFGAHVLI
jgi:hypothetical protein